MAKLHTVTLTLGCGGKKKRITVMPSEMARLHAEAMKFGESMAGLAERADITNVADLMAAAERLGMGEDLD